MKKKIFWPLLALPCLFLPATTVCAQSNELVQLILNVEKLEQFKAIIKQMKDGYDLAAKRYQAVQDIAKGQFSLHQLFLDQLLEVSPEVRQYEKIAQIIAHQLSIVREYKNTLAYCRQVAAYSADDMAYMEKVYGGVTDRAARRLDDLTMVLTTGSVRMNDAERLAFIDDIHSGVTDLLHFLRYFNGRAILLGTHKLQGREETTRLQKLFEK